MGFAHCGARLVLCIVSPRRSPRGSSCELRHVPARINACMHLIYDPILLLFFAKHTPIVSKQTAQTGPRSQSAHRPHPSSAGQGPCLSPKRTSSPRGPASRSAVKRTRWSSASGTASRRHSRRVTATTYPRCYTRGGRWRQAAALPRAWAFPSTSRWPPASWRLVEVRRTLVQHARWIGSSSAVATKVRVCSRSDSRRC